MKLRSGLLALLASAAALAAPGLRLRGEPFLPYRINHAVAFHEGGVLGNLELQGQRWDGSEVTLFRTQVKARSQAVALAFYLDEDIRRLILRVGGPETRQVLAVELAAAGAGGAAMPVDEIAACIRMRRLTPPVYLAPGGEAPERFSLLGSDLATAGLQASSSLFRIPVSPTPLWLLGGFAGFALILAVLPFHSRRGKRLARLIAVGMATLAILFLVDRRPILFSVTFPGDDPDVVSGLGPDTTWGSTRGDAEGAKRPGGPPSFMSGARLSGTFERLVDEQPGYRRIAYLAAQGQVELVGLWAPLAPSLPLGAVVPPGAWARFSAVPLLTMAEGEVFIGAQGFVTGWVVHESR